MEGECLKMKGDHCSKGQINTEPKCSTYPQGKLKWKEMSSRPSQAVVLIEMMIKFPYYYTWTLKKKIKKSVIKHLLEKNLADIWTVGILLFTFL